MTGAAAGSGRWADLSRRLISTVVLLAIGIVLAMASGIWLRMGMAVIIGITFWELARLTGWRHPEMHDTPFGRWRPLGLAVLAGGAVYTSLNFFDEWGPVVLLIPVLAGLPGAAQGNRWVFAVFGLAILLVGFGLVGFREVLGLPFVLWLMGIVITSDIAGYFAGKIIGGPKFWPRLSPKKTWSGTAAGWVGALIVGAVLVATGAGDPALLWISPLVAFAGQMGDIAESWLKRRAGVKDSSNLIPGHGGFMDRFDAITGATLAVMAIGLIATLPRVL
ncbi:MAG: phosphatidate cytidylyltransferase [Paracoccus sp. (in: a-proteobacteria)]|uniref:phosphatidate cytidylyltransferase n=1 Tax=Paracoccus sp. TaxID=267 RepID=UPI0026E01232|nr:phosphatidate cytidylyltransferase [Paracoccus sp. (in: a-proteobacteria)]MDO5614311.1 phosphatidate cytidylyltransferase [Paracoccus sp. (in: a-proteobacteria)]